MPTGSETFDQAKAAAEEVNAKRAAVEAAKKSYDEALSEATAYYQRALATAKERYEAAKVEAKSELDASVNDAKLAFEKASREFSEASTNLQALRTELLSVFGDVLEPKNPRVRVAG